LRAFGSLVLAATRDVFPNPEISHLQRGRNQSTGETIAHGTHRTPIPFLYSVCSVGQRIDDFRELSVIRGQRICGLKIVANVNDSDRYYHVDA